VLLACVLLRTGGIKEHTHFFARANEPKLGQQLAVALGKFGFDLPRRYDIICSGASVQASGKLETKASDHDLVWARVVLAWPQSTQSTLAAKKGALPIKAEKHVLGDHEELTPLSNSLKFTTCHVLACMAHA